MENFLFVKEHWVIMEKVRILLAIFFVLITIFFLGKGITGFHTCCVGGEECDVESLCVNDPGENSNTFYLVFSLVLLISAFMIVHHS